MYLVHSDNRADQALSQEPFTDWLDWLGMEHQVGADPRTDGKACCLIIAKIVAAAHGIRFPVDTQPLLVKATSNDFSWVEELFNRHTKPIGLAFPGCIALLRNEVTRYGIGTVVSDGSKSGLYLLVPHHKRGLIAIPLTSTRSISFCRIIQ